MRQFFLDTLNNLDKIAGLRQIEKLMAMPDAKKEINDLLDELCKVCGMFSYIPDLDKQNIIRESMLNEDSDKFTSLNARIVFKWLDKVKGPYFARSTEQIQVPEDYKPVVGEERDKWIDLFLKQVQSIAPPAKSESKGTIIRSSLMNIQEPTDMKEIYRMPSFKEIQERERHIEWIRANFDYLTGEKLPCYLSEKEWNKLNYK